MLSRGVKGFFGGGKPGKIPLLDNHGSKHRLA